MLSKKNLRKKYPSLFGLTSVEGVINPPKPPSDLNDLSIAVNKH